MGNQLVFVGNRFIQFFQGEVNIRDKTHQRTNMLVRAGVENGLELTLIRDERSSQGHVPGFALWANVSLPLHLVETEEATNLMLLRCLSSHQEFLSTRLPFLARKKRCCRLSTGRWEVREQEGADQLLRW